MLSIKIYDDEQKFIYEEPEITYRHIKETTGSMRPFIVEDVEVIYEEVIDKTVLNLGDVCIYEDSFNILSKIQHRIIFIGEINNQTYYIFKGDNNLYPDEGFVTKNSILKKLIGIKYV